MRDNPSLAGRPVIVAPTSNLSPVAVARSTSEVASASYEARAKGVRARMFLRDAHALCPDAVFLPCTYDKYEEASKGFYSALRQFTTLSEAVSADEAYLGTFSTAQFATLVLTFSTDMSNVGWDDIDRVVGQMRELVFASIGCDSSAGVGPNKLLARLATQRAKDLKQSQGGAGQFLLTIPQFSAFSQYLAIEQLPSVGPALGGKLRAKGVTTVGELRQLSKQQLVAFGPKTGERLHKYARGIDERPVSSPPLLPPSLHSLSTLSLLSLHSLSLSLSLSLNVSLSLWITHSCILALKMLLPSQAVSLLLSPKLFVISLSLFLVLFTHTLLLTLFA